ncbi:MAG: GNAT family N-acetyltransferase [Pseudomonadota bacterium]|nr:GNAT family N-acetyltransferase [Pseudomonadota bacterium]
MFDSSLQDAFASSPAAAAPRIHLASPADVPFIVDAIVAESRHGHFSCDCTQPDVLRGLWHQVQTIVSDGVTPMPDSRNGAGGRAFVIQLGSVNAGFAILVEHAPGSWLERVELFALATHEAYRGRGLARMLVQSLAETSQSALVYARCAEASVAMSALLKACGFEAQPQTGNGTVTHVLPFRAVKPETRQ